ncbi:hypothetical protein MKW92_035430 [Papaver armeniacum]|nr:hypothetical protein MKW92_035430 [Papaver armeniacum]
MATIKSIDYPVFVETNLNTHLVATITNTDTVGHFKEKIVLEHRNCFPMHNNIVLNAIKVKRKKCFYHLSDPVPVKSVFERVKGTWFLYVDAVSLKEIDAENQLHRKQALEPEKLIAAHGTSADLAVKPVERSGNAKKKKNPAIQQVKSIATPSDLKRKLSEASLDTEAKVISKTRIEKKRCTKVSDAETGLLNSGAGKNDSTNNVVPVISMTSEKALVADHPRLEARKAVKTVVASSPCLKKGQNEAAALNDNSSKCVPKDGKAGGENTQMPSGILEHSMEKSYPEGVNGSTNEDPKSSSAEGEGIDFMEHFLPKDHEVV